MTYGTVNADVIGTSVTGSNLGAGNASIMKNRIINGAMVINQRGFSGTAVDSTYSLDRWFTSSSQTSKFTISQSSVAPVGFSNSLLATSSSAYSITSSDIFSVNQFIEGFNTADLGWGTANAKTVTLSFWVQSSLTGTFGGAINNSALNYSYPFSYTISSANTWEQKSITIAGPTSGTWIGATNGVGLRIFMSIGSGSTVSGTAGAWASALYTSATGATSVVGTNGATFYITGVQLEVGSSATGYEYRQYGQELSLCQRYCYKLVADGTAVFTRFAIGGNINSTAVDYVITLPQQMRVTPSLTTTGTASNYATYVANTLTALSAVPFINSVGATPALGAIQSTSSGGLTAGQCTSLISNNIGSAYLTFTAEL